MVHQLPEVLGASHPRRAEAEALAARCYEITTFLVEQRDYHPGPLGQGQTLTYHDSCAGLRELGVKTAPRILLERAGYILVEMAQAETCCGFGGTFCVKYPEISVAMADEKLASAGQAGASLVVGGDVGCLLHLAGRHCARSAPLAFRHVLELLVPEREQPRALGQGTP
jgi:L-lactate dehydrogenase complex protein LldE